jgi:hypothetical protein
MTKYAFIITGQHGSRIFSLDGTFKSTPGMTRSVALADIVALVKKRNGIDADARIIITFFSLEPNPMGGAS